jgi:hypothetical protein
LSRKFYHIAADTLLWRAAYYERFILPRVARLPKGPGRQLQLLSFSARVKKMLDESSYKRKGRKFDWKNMYKLRHNWALGICTVREIPVGEHNLEPPMLVKFHDRVIYTVDTVSGLRAWSSEAQSFENTDLLLASRELKGISPTSLVTDAASEDGKVHTLVVGFQDGSFAIFSFWKESRRFDLMYEHESSSNGMLVGLALYSSFLLTMTASHLLSIYKLCWAEDGVLTPPLLLHSLRSQTGCPPVIVSLRLAAETIIAAVAYPIPPMVTGPWSIGLQEIHLSSDGKVLDSRTAVSMASRDTTLGSSLSHSSPEPSPFPTTFGSSRPTPQPTSISYAHPYLLLSHTDNTLSMFLISSTVDELVISRPTRLWGHTSSVSGAHVEGKGKAVSVSKSGDDIRIWELEGSVGRHRIFASVPVVPGRAGFQTERSDDAEQNPVAVRGSVGFDDENVVLLREKVVGPPELVVYDFK